MQELPAAAEDGGRGRTVLTPLIVAAAAGVLVYLAAFYCASTVLARLSASGRIDVHVNTLYWLARLASAAVAIPLAVLLSRRLRRLSWAGRRAIAIAAVLAAIFVFSIDDFYWRLYGYRDGDTALLPTTLVNQYLFSPVPLPPSATDIHAFIVGGQNPSLWLRFKADPSDARDFLNRTLAAREMGDETLRSRDLKFKPSELSNKPWWTARDDLPWRYQSRRPGNEFFIQLDDRDNTIYLMVSVQ